MKAYFQLQFKRLNRKMIDFGIPLLIRYTLLPFLFFLISNFLFDTIEYAKYLYILVALSFVSKLSEPKRNGFLKAIFKRGKYRKIRLIENLIYCLPFTLLMIYNYEYFFTLLLNLLVILMSLFNFNLNLNRTIPTPFSKKPFEFTVGFRKTFYLFPIAYVLTYISVTVDNFNLGIASMILIGIICFSYYSKIENEFYVWNYNLSSKAFLLEKTKTCLTYFSLLSLPIIIVLAVCFYNEIDILLIFLMLSYAYLTAIICAKYSSFPDEMNMSQGILIAASLMFPLILLIFIPFFYSQSIKKLNTILND